MKALFRPFALHAAYTPIETIVFFCIIGTLAYFHILHAIKHSLILDQGRTDNVYSPPVVRPAHVLFKSGEWVGVRESAWVQSAEGAVELQQVIYTVDGVKMKGAKVCPSFLNFTCSDGVPDTRRALFSSLLVNRQHFSPPHYRLSLFLR
jgi:hydroxymethylglutaryl-CoA reductase (NADPH)